MGIQFGRYGLVRLLGRGGMAEVYKAKTTGPSGFVKFIAIKTIRPDVADDPRFVTMFIDEAKLAATFMHPNLIAVFDFGEIDGRLYLAMEYVAGGNVDQLIRRLRASGATLPVHVASYLLLEACRGLGHAHARTDLTGKPLGLVHRDISPHNLLVSANGEVKVADFGIAKATGGARTGDGQLIGKIAYMSPEQVDFERLDGRSDLFSLGIVYYEMLTGERLFDGDSDAIISKIRTFEPARDLAHDVPCRDLLVRLLQPERDDRPIDAGAIEAELMSQIDSIAHARRDLASLATRLFTDEIEADARDAVDADPSSASNVPGSLFGASAIVTIPPRVTRDLRKDKPVRPARHEPVVEVVARPIDAAFARTVRARSELTARRPVRWPRLAIVVVGVALAAGVPALRASVDQPTRPPHGGTMQLASSLPIGEFDIYPAGVTRSRMLLEQVIEPLMRTSHDGEIHPWLLSSAEPRDGGREVVLSLRPGVTFHAHPCLGGRERVATAKDLAYSIRQAFVHAEVTLPIRGIDALRRGEITDGIVETAPGEVTLRMTAPAPFYRNALASMILIPSELEGCENLRDLKQPVGTGPFRFTAPPSGLGVKLVRAPHYWRRGPDGDELPYVDALEMAPIEAMPEVLSRLGAGSVDMVQLPDNDPAIDFSSGEMRLPDRLAQLADVAGRTTNNLMSVVGICRSSRVGPFSDLRVRRAIALALDRAALVSTAKSRWIGKPTGRFFEPKTLGYDGALLGFGQDLETARRLLREAGFGNGLKLVFGTNRDDKLVAAIAAQLAPLGIEITTTSVTPPFKTSQIDASGIDAYVLTWQAEIFSGEPDQIVRQMLRFADSPALDQLDKLLSVAMDPAARAPIYRRIEQTLLDELPIVPLAHRNNQLPIHVFLVGKHLRGFHDPVTRYARLENLAESWLER